MVTTNRESTLLIGVYKACCLAELAAAELQRRGFPPDRMRIILCQAELRPTVTTANVAETAAAGAAPDSEPGRGGSAQPVVHVRRGILVLRPGGRQEEAAALLCRYAGCDASPSAVTEI
jgi:hypothetical protein